jgi:predicted dehydrogenase
MKTVEIGLIGCGAMGLDMAQRLLRCDERLRARAIYDPDPRSLERARSSLGTSVTVCSDLPEMMAIPDLSWVMIASWNCYHYEQVMAAFEAGKHVFCQKPLALRLDHCVDLLQAWRASGRIFHLGLTLRFSSHYRRIHELIASGRIGRIVSLEFNETLDFNHGGYIMGDWRRLRKNAGTHLLEKCCHDIDLASWMIGARARRVASFGGLDFFLPQNAYRIRDIGPSPDGKPAYGTWNSLVDLNPFESDKDIVDNQVVLLEYENGVRATFHTNCNAALPERRMYILGTEGAIRADVLTGSIELRRIGFDTPVEDESTAGRGGHGGGDDVLAAELADSMLNGRPPAAGLIEGVESAVTCFAIDEAMDAGTVVDLADYWQAVDSA